MTSSTSSSSSVRVPLVAALAVACLAACATSRPPQAPAGGDAARPRPRVLVLPPENLATGPISSREVTFRLEQMVAMAGADVIGGERLDEYLAQVPHPVHRRRRPGGREGRAGGPGRRRHPGHQRPALERGARRRWPSRAGSSPPPTIPAVLWMDGYARTGDDAPGLFALDVVGDPADPQERGPEAARPVPGGVPRARSAAPRCVPEAGGGDPASPTGPVPTSGRWRASPCSPS